MPRRRLVLLIAIVTSLALLALFWRANRSRTTGDERASATDQGATTDRATKDLAHERARQRQQGSPVPTARLEQALADYRRVAIYPPWSRAHDEGTAYKLRWNDAIVSDLPLDDRPGSETMYRFGADRHHVVFGEALTSWIEVWKLGDEGHKLPVTVHKAWVLAVGGDGRTLELPYNDNGLDGDAVAGDHRYTNRFVPSAHDELKTAKQVQISADVESGGARRGMIRDFTYAPRPVLEILGITEQIKDGSLVVTLDVQVYEAGLHTFEANLMSGDGATAIAYTDLSYPLPVGRTTADLVFFGKVFHDKGLDGPYQVRDLRGLLRMEGGESNLWWSDARTYETKPYRLADFSSAEWDAEEKREKIRAMEEVIAQAESGAAPSTGQPAHIHIDENGVARPTDPPPLPRP